MCLICISYQKEQMTAFEAWNALDEMAPVIGEDHLEEVIDMIWDELDVFSIADFTPDR